MNFLFFFSLFLYGCGVSTSSSQESEFVLLDMIQSNIIDETNTSTTKVIQETQFDSSDDAVYDENACDSKFPTTELLKDSNDDNGSDKFDVDNGIKVKSFYPSELGELNSTVTLYYTAFPTTSTLKNDRTRFYGEDPEYGSSIYSVAYDLSWVNVANNFLYIKLPKLANKKSSCYKLVLDQEEGTDAIAQKVYR